MPQAYTSVIKKARVKLGEPRPIGSAMLPPPDASGGAPGQPSARILEQDDAHAVIEVTCPCGQTIQLNCEYPTNET